MDKFLGVILGERLDFSSVTSSSLPGEEAKGAMARRFVLTMTHIEEILRVSGIREGWNGKSTTGFVADVYCTVISVYRCYSSHNHGIDHGVYVEADRHSSTWSSLSWNADSGSAYQSSMITHNQTPTYLWVVYNFVGL
jgi:hypothetical protein